jgi:putative flippase GtrA
VVACTIGSAIAVGCLAISHYLLGLTSPLADNISANVVGLILGTAFRFWAYRTFVFIQDHPTDAADWVETAS